MEMLGWTQVLFKASKPAMCLWERKEEGQTKTDMEQQEATRTKGIPIRSKKLLQ